MCGSEVEYSNIWLQGVLAAHAQNALLRRFTTPNLSCDKFGVVNRNGIMRIIYFSHTWLEKTDEPLGALYHMFEPRSEISIDTNLQGVQMFGQCKKLGARKINLKYQRR